MFLLQRSLTILVVLTVLSYYFVWVFLFNHLVLQKPCTNILDQLFFKCSATLKLDEVCEEVYLYSFKEKASFETFLV